MVARPPQKADSARYYLGFRAISLRPELARIVAENYLAAGSWDAAKARVLSSNALQCRTPRTATRIEGELRLRLQTLTAAQLSLLAQANADDRAAIAWLGAIKHIALAFDLAADVLRDKLASHDPVLRPSDYEGFMEYKSLTHPELAGLGSYPKIKIRQVLLRMLVEAGLLKKGDGFGVIQRPVLSPQVVEAIVDDSPSWLAGFLIPDTEERTR